jgi:hypothetical protein
VIGSVRCVELAAGWEFPGRYFGSRDGAASRHRPAFCTESDKSDCARTKELADHRYTDVEDEGGRSESDR